MKHNYEKHLKVMALTWAISFLVMMLAYMLMLTPQVKTKADNYNKIDKKTKIRDSARFTTQAENKNNLNKQLNDLKTKLGNLVYPAKDKPGLTYEITTIAKQENVSMFSIGPGDRTSYSSFSGSKYCEVIHYNLEFNASFDQFAIFLNALERHHPVIFVDQFNITRNDKNYSQHHVLMSLAIIVEKSRI